MKQWMRSAIFVVIFAGIMVISSGAPEPVGADVAPDRHSLAPTIEDVVIVTTDPAVLMYGCDSINVHRIDSGEPLFLGPTSVSPSRLAATADLSVVVAINSDLGSSFPPVSYDGEPAQTEPYLLKQFIYMLRRVGSDWSRWDVHHRVVGAEFAMAGGIAIMPDGDTLLAATAHRVNGTGAPTGPPYRVEKYRLSEITASSGPEGTDEMGVRHGAIEIPSVAAEIIPASDGRLAHIVTESMEVITVDTTSMTETAARVQMAAIQPPNYWPPSGLMTEWVHAVLSVDERYLITNRVVATELNIADLTSRQTWTLPVASEIIGTTGVAINRGADNHGLLAIRGRYVGVYQFNPLGPLVEIGRSEEILGGGVAPRNAIAWSARGDAIVVASGVRIDGKPHSFAVLDVADQGQTITMRTRLSDCVAGISPNDVITANGFVPTPTVTPTTPVTPSATHTNAATATSTPAFTPTATPTHEPLPIYLPLTVTESCDRTQQHADVVLVIDTSTSMLRYTGGGRTKLAAAQEATSAFLGMMDFTGDEGEARDQVAIVGFNEQAWVEAPLTTSAGALSHAVNRLAEKVAQGTRLDLALDEGIKALQASSREPDNTPVLILLTDGLPNRVPTPVAGGSQEETVLAAALRAKELGISIYTIGVGRPDASDPIDRINPQLLCAVASVPSMYYETPDAEDLKAIYSEIAQDIMCPAEQFWGRRP